MRICLSRVAVSTVVVLVFQSAVWGQFSGNLGSSGGRSTGSSPAAGGVGPGGSSTPSLDSGTGVSELSGSDRFLRDSRQPGEFVGADAADTREFVGRAGAGGTGRQQSFQRGTSRLQNANRGGTTRRSTAEIRSAIRLGFDYRRPVPVDLNSALTARLQRATRFRALSPLDVSVGGGTATLRGEVSTSYDRALVEQLVRLEPGIWQVKNELTVAEVKPLEALQPPTQPAPPSPSPESQ